MSAVCFSRQSERIRHGTTLLFRYLGNAALQHIPLPKFGNSVKIGMAFIPSSGSLAFLLGRDVVVLSQQRHSSH